MAKRLVINADDFGFSEDVNERIVKCYTKGAVTDISILSCGDSFKHAVGLAKKNGLNRIGIHLALTGRFKAVSPREEIATLLGRDERFPRSYRSFLARYFIGIVKKSEIYTEFRSQVLKLRNAGFKITHLDSHEHIHMAPGVLKVVARLSEEEGIEYIRFPLERIDFFSKLNEPQVLVRNAMLSSMCDVSKKILDTSGIKHNDFFLGHASRPRLKREDIISAISNLKSGLTELGCHPGNREEEEEVLCDTRFADELKARSVELVSY